MKPRDLTEKNWNVYTAIFDEIESLEIRVYASANAIEFRYQTAIGTADIPVPIKTWRKIVDFLAAFKKDDLDKEHRNLTYFPDKSHELMIFDGYHKSVRTKITKFPMTVAINKWPRRASTWGISIRMAQFRKIVKWYNSDVK